MNEFKKNTTFLDSVFIFIKDINNYISDHRISLQKSTKTPGKVL